MWRGISINIPWKIYQGRQSSCPLGFYIKVIVRVFNWRQCLAGIMNLKPTAGCQRSTLMFEKKIWRGISINIPWKIYKGRQMSCLGFKINGIAQVFYWLKCLGGIMHLKPTAGCQISTLIFDFFYGGGSLLISHENISRTAKFLTTCSLCQRYCPGL